MTLEKSYSNYISTWLRCLPRARVHTRSRSRCSTASCSKDRCLFVARTTERRSRFAISPRATMRQICKNINGLRSRIFRIARYHTGVVNRTGNPMGCGSSLLTLVLGNAASRFLHARNVAGNRARPYVDGSRCEQLQIAQPAVFQTLKDRRLRCASVSVLCRF